MEHNNKQNMKKILILNIHPSMFLTFLGVSLGTFSLYFSSIKNIKFALIFLCIAGMCDAFDGTFANHFKRTDEDKQLGIQFDSLSDIFISGVLPVCILLSMGFTSFYSIIIYFIFISCSIYRLAFFNVHCLEFKNHFKGVPITFSTILFPLLYLFTKSECVYLVFMLLLALLFVSNINIKKPTILVKSILSIIGISIIFYVIFMKVNLG